MNRQPQRLSRFAIAGASANCSSRCSGAMVSHANTASSQLPTISAKPFFRAARALLAVGNVASCRSTAAFTAATSFAELVTSIGRASLSCSACASRSAASVSGFAASSATISNSEGPANMSIRTRSETSNLAAVTHRLPGPTITSQRGTSPQPPANAPIACAPPAWSKPSTLATAAAASIKGDATGDATQMLVTPATRAVTAVINRLETSGNLPPGT